MRYHVMLTLNIIVQYCITQCELQDTLIVSILMASGSSRNCACVRIVICWQPLAAQLERHSASWNSTGNQCCYYNTFINLIFLYSGKIEPNVSGFLKSCVTERHCKQWSSMRCMSNDGQIPFQGDKLFEPRTC